MADDEQDYDGQNDNELTFNGTESKKRKRNRAALSCTNCKSRKIKCSRTMPCEGCIKRNVAATCHWADNTVEPPPPVFALETVVDSIRENLESRLAHLETLLNVQGTTPSDVAAKKALQDTFQAGIPNSNQPPAQAHTNGQASSSTQRLGPANAQTDEAERAAMALEVLAGGDEVSTVLDVKPRFLPDTRTHAEWAAESLIWRDFPEPYVYNPRLPLLVGISRATVVDTFLGYVRTRETCRNLLQVFWLNTGWVLASMTQKRFMQESEIFWDLVERGERQFDPSYIALLSVILATALQGLSDDQYGHLLSSDLCDLTKVALEVSAWRTRPCIRVVQTLYQCGLLMQSSETVSAAFIWLGEAIRAAQALGLNKLGSDATQMPAEDRAVQSGTLYARETAIRLWHDLVAQDWIGSTITSFYTIHPSTFNTPLPRNFDEDQLEHGLITDTPRPPDVFTTAQLYIGKAETADFCRRMIDLGPVPTNPVELDKYYTGVLELDQKLMNQNKRFFTPGGGWSDTIKGAVQDWKLLIAISGMNTRRIRLHRPLMTRGYVDQKFSFSTRICVEASQAVLASLSKLAELKAPTGAVWFLRRHAMSAILALYIDVFHSADTESDWQASEAKLVNMPGVMSIFRQAESSRYEKIRETGRKARLLIQALDDAKIARRQSRGLGKPEDYGSLLKRIASSVHTGATSNIYAGATETSASASSSSNTSTPWMEDESTRQLLSSLGLLEPDGHSSQALFDDSYLWDANSNIFATQLSEGFDLLDMQF